MDVYGVDSRLQPRVSLLTLLDKLDEYVIQVLGEVKKEQIELAASLVNRTDERNKYRPSRLIDMFVPPNQAADMQSNLAEIFPLWVERHGLAVAHRIRKVQIARLIIGEYWNKVIELIKAVKIAGS